ncbi:hypothetical protein FAP59_18795 [Morganella morganii]|nr:hypothetical protein [Morganella morganii]
MMMLNLNKPTDLTLPGLSLSPDALARYLPLKFSGRVTPAYKQEAKIRLIRVLCQFRTETLKQRTSNAYSLTIGFPDDYDEDWRWLLLLSAQVCLCRYSLKKILGNKDHDGQDNIDYRLAVDISGRGTQPELCRILLEFLWPRFCHYRRRGWHHYVRSLREMAGSEIGVAPVVRETWRREFCVQWILSVWTDIQTRWATHIELGEETK